MRRYKEMMAVVSDAKNHSAYRQELIKARPPVVPYLGKASSTIFVISLAKRSHLRCAPA
jgi:hypothetical protein